MEIELTANAGLVADFTSGFTVLIDALHCRRTRFSPVSPDVISSVMAIPADCVLVTHGHADHYDEELVVRYLTAHPSAIAVAPFEIPGIAPERQRILTKSEGTLDVGPLQITYVRLRHEGDKYRDVANYGYAVRAAEESVAVLGDAAMDEVHRGLTVLTEDGPITVAAVNFPVLTLRKGKEVLRDVRVQNLAGIHLPFAEDDVEGYRRSAQRAAPRTAQSVGIPAMLLMEEKQRAHF